MTETQYFAPLSCSAFGGMRLALLLAALVIADIAVGAVALHAQAAGRYDHYPVDDPDLPAREEYASRRKRVLEQLDTSAAMFVRSADERNRSNDVDYEFRQRNSLLYLSGVKEAGAALLLSRRPIVIDGAPTSEVLFVIERNRQLETWTGLRMGPVAAAKVTGMTTVLPITRMRGVLDSLLPRLRTLYYDDWLQKEAQEPLTGITYQWQQEQTAALKARCASLTVRGAAEIIDPMRQIKSPAEIALLQRAVDISIEGHRAAMRAGRPSAWEYEIEAAMEYEFQRRGAESPGYPSIVGSGPNTCILHYETSRRQTEDGDLVLMDCGAEYHGYSADVTRTFPVSGTFTSEQRAIYDLVLEAQMAGIDLCRRGNDFRAPHRRAVEIITAGLKRLGIIKDDIKYRAYFMHGTSHFLGMDVHDVGDPGMLLPGMVLTVEPGVYIPAGSDCDPKWWNIGVRIEDDILVTGDAPVNLSGALERTADDIEALVRSAR